MHVLYSRRCAKSDSVSSDEIVKLGENLLETSTDSDARECATQLLTYLYDELGEREKALKMAESRPFMVLSREFMLRHLGDADERYERTRLLIHELASYLVTELGDYPHMKRTDGSDVYSPEERFELREKQISLCEIIFEDGNLGFEHTRLANTQFKQALYFAGKGELDASLERLERAADHALGFIDYAERGREFRHTSLLFRGMNGGSFSTGNDDNEASELLDSMKNPTLDPIRSSECFGAIEARLEARAGKWEKNR